MSCDACLNAFKASPNKVDAVNAATDIVCGCEKHSVSPHSPGVVGDDENLHFLVYTPEGRSPNGKLSPALLMQADKEGLSTLRDSAGNTEFEETMKEIRPRWQTNGRSLEGVMTFPVAAIRYKSEKRFACVYDTAMEAKPWHADVMLPLITGESATKTKKLRYERLKELVDLIGSNFCDMDKFRDGSLSHIGSASS